jgi:hypothetical protein
VARIASLHNNNFALNAIGHMGRTDANHVGHFNHNTLSADADKHAQANLDPRYFTNFPTFADPCHFTNRSTFTDPRSWRHAKHHHLLHLPG